MPESDSHQHKDDGLLAGQHAVVTGGGRGIGAAIAEELARQGASVTLVGRNVTALQAQSDRIGTQFGCKTNFIGADITDEHLVEAAFKTASDALGPVAILINNAGAAESAPFGRTDPDLWRRMLDVNLTGTYLCCRAAVPAMAAASYGRIVNIASTAGQIGYPYVTAYCAAKHGVIGLTRALALELAAKHITVNAVCPGFTDTDMTAESIRNIVEKTGRDDAAAREELTRTNPLGRLIQPDEVARTVGWLVAPGAGAVTGQSIAVAGGEVMP